MTGRTKSGIDYSYHFTERLVERPDALGFALGGHAALFRDGLTNVISLTGQERAWYCVRQQPMPSVVGVLVFYLCEDEPCIQVELAYVNPHDRHEGIFRKLMSSLYTDARVAGVKLSIGTHVRNTRMQSILKRMGAVQQYLVYDYPVLP